MKKKVMALWAVFAVCLVVTVILNRCMMKSDVAYEEVQATVLSAREVNTYNRRTHTTITKYKIEVQYKGKSYQLENAHNTYMYREGSKVTAYLANGRLFADVEGVRTSTPLATVYFVFLIGSIVLFFTALMYMGKLAQKK